ncbi:N-acetylglucosaminyl-diphospho-decaprenol L-rhamnosyltransferase [Actinotalea ferrariae CF5-4]|uniref:N-acetylglucosaminyl-diphospho-decaprenol L-rhamnosyltransferase n=1 Tax=Actinotalea ferrariae CF5-4 TaxID=948458 RepID=A0A021VPC1_9CELL|nr:glycosyltransferase family 2 protein [Actinotalea ferrariae]EYR61880.1 N-acetylglucosaminyl-diphospho-decaprenol L-rhamnosyltransferase [Actinotalea ferrariae CF5-4]
MSATPPPDAAPVPSRPPADVLVVSVAYHPGPELAQFAASLSGATTRPYRLVLVDNGTDPTAVDEVARESGATVLRTGENLGYGRAANRAAAGATEPWLVVANPDVVWHPGSLDALLAAAGRHPGAGALGPAVLNVDGTVYPSARELPSLTQGVGHALLARVWPGNPWTRAYQARQETTGSGERPAGWLSGSCLLLRREAFEAVGGFDERYFMFFEDLDLGERLAGAGWTNVHVPGAEVTHVGGASWRERPDAMIRAHHRSAALYLSGRYDRWYQAPLRLVIRLGLAARQAVELRSSHRR